MCIVYKRHILCLIGCIVSRETTKRMKKFTSEKQKVGELGEDIACRFLMKHDFEILERNYTRKWGEIDIVATKKNKLYFIEVKSISKNLNLIEHKKSEKEIDHEKSKNQNTSYRPEENMHPQKMRRMSRIVQTYLISKRIGNTPWQVDLLIVYIDQEKRLARVKTIENLIL